MKKKKSCHSFVDVLTLTGVSIEIGSKLMCDCIIQGGVMVHGELCSSPERNISQREKERTQTATSTSFSSSIFSCLSAFIPHTYSTLEGK